MHPYLTESVVEAAVVAFTRHAGVTTSLVRRTVALLLVVRDRLEPAFRNWELKRGLVPGNLCAMAGCLKLTIISAPVGEVLDVMLARETRR